MKIKPEHVTEVTTGLRDVWEHIQVAKKQSPGTTAQLVEQLRDVGNKLIANNANGGAKHIPGTEPGGIKHPTAGRGL